MGNCRGLTSTNPETAVLVLMSLLKKWSTHPVKAADQL